MGPSGGYGLWASYPALKGARFPHVCDCQVLASALRAKSAKQSSSDGRRGRGLVIGGPQALYVTSLYNQPVCLQIKLWLGSRLEPKEGHKEIAVS